MKFAGHAELTVSKVQFSDNVNHQIQMIFILTMKMQVKERLIYKSQEHLKI